MAFILKDRVKENSTTTGTGNISLGGASATFDTFQSYLTNGDTTYYAIAHTSSGVDEWEVGLGTWNTGNTLSRTTVLAGSNGTSAVDFSAGTKDIFMTYPASKAAVVGEDVTFADITVTGTVDGRDVAADGSKLDGIETSADVTDAVTVAAAGALMRSGGTMTGNLILNADPNAALGAATKQYVDTIASAGIHYHPPVRAEHPSNLNATYNNGSSGVGATLTNAGTNAALVIDSVSMVLNDRVLVANQTDQTQNGVYTVTTVGDGSTAWVLTRSTDTDTAAPSDPDAFGKGDAFFIKEGSTNAGHLDVLSTSGTIVFGTTNIVFSEVAETTVYSGGTGITLTGTTFSIGQDVGTTSNVTFNQVTAAIIGNVTGNLTGDVTGNADTATALETARTIQLSGDVTGSASFDGTANINITAAVQDDSHAHVISNVDGLQSALDAKVPTSRIITAGNGLTGGGDLSANRTLTVGGGSGITVNANDIAIDSSYTGFDGRYYTETEADSRFANVTGDTFTGDLLVQDDIKSTGQIRATGWWNTNTGTTGNDLAVEMGISGGLGYILSYNRSTASYGSLNFNATAFAFNQRPTFSGNTAFDDGYHPNADKWTTSRTLSLSGDASGSVSWDGSANATLSVTVANDSHSHSWSAISGDTRQNYSARFRPANSGEYAGFQFYNTAGGNAGYFLISGSAVNNSTYQPDGITLVSDSGWLSLVSRSTTNTGVRITTGSTPATRMIISDAGDIDFTGSSFEYNSNTVWHAGNDGSGSGLDADLLDGVQGNKYFTSYNNAGTTGWEDSNRNFRINSGGNAVGFAMHESDGTFGFQLYGDGSYYGFLDGNWAGWDIQKQINGALRVDEGSGLQRVFNDGYHPNADTLTTARTINGVSFNGSANITIADSTKLPLSGGTMTGSLNIGAAIGSRSNTISVDGDSNSSPIVVQCDTVDNDWGVLPWTSGETYIHGGVYYDDGAWVHRSSNTTNYLLRLNGGIGAGWYASNNSSASWNLASNVSLWNSSGTWVSAVAKSPTLTLSGDATGSATFTNLGNATLSVTVADDSHNHTWDNIDGGSVNSWSSLRVSTSSGYIDFGPANTTWAHIYTDRPNFYFNRDLYVNNQRVYHTGYHPNADTLTTARTINGVSFNGSANITVADSTKLPLSGGTVTGTLTLSQDGQDVLHFSANDTNDNRGIAFNNRTALSADYNDGYLRLNNGSEFSNGIYTPGALRVDGNLTVASRIYHTGDSDTYLDFIADNTWRVVTGNTEGLRVSAGSIDVPLQVRHSGDNDTYMQFNTNEIFFQTGGSQELTINAVGVRLGDTGNGYFRPVSGDFGSIEIDGGSHGGWEGYNIGGRAVFMHNNGSVTGIYNDVDNEWLFYANHNSYTRMYHNGSSKVETTSTGVTVTGNVNSTSDIRYKKNIKTIEGAVDKVNALRGVTFDWDNDAFPEDESTKKQNFTERATGVIAQDVEKVLPEAVTENPETGFKNVSYGNMVGLLIEAIKEQQTQIDDLKSEIQSMKS